MAELKEQCVCINVTSIWEGEWYQNLWNVGSSFLERRHKFLRTLPSSKVVWPLLKTLNTWGCPPLIKTN